MLYWLFHFKCAPYHTNWKIHATLENDMQNWFYFFEVLFLMTGFVYSKIGGNELLWTVGLSCIYFSAVIMMILKLVAFVKRYKAQKDVDDGDKEEENVVNVIKSVLVSYLWSKVTPEEMEIPEIKTQKSTSNKIITKANSSKVAVAPN